MQPLAKHLADFLVAMLASPGAEAYCRRCLTYWTAEYGEAVVAEVLGRLSRADRERLGLSDSSSWDSPAARRTAGRS